MLVKNKKHLKSISLIVTLSSLLSCSKGESGIYLSRILKSPEGVSHNSSIYNYYNDANYNKFKEKVKDFSIRFSSAYSTFAVKGNETNIICSPLSIFLCLGLAVTSTSGSSQKEILDAFDLDYETFKKYYTVYFDDLIFEEKGEKKNVAATLSFTNSAWFDKSCKTVNSGLESLKNDNYCYSLQSDFKNDNEKTNKAIRQFIKDKTNGLIDEDFEFETRTLLALINTLYLLDSWNDSASDLPYAENTSPEYIFTNSDGSKSNKKLLSGYYFGGEPLVRDTFTSFYTSTRYCNIYFIVPTGDNKINDIFTYENITSVVDTNNYVDYNEELNEEYYTRSFFPEFEVYNYSDKIKEILTDDFNINTIFNPGECDFSKIIDNDAFVSRVIHVARLALDKKGIEGAAVTIIDVGEKSNSPRDAKIVKQDFFVNKEFGFILTRRKGIVFSGIINNIG